MVVVGLDGAVKITQDADVTGARRTQGHWIGIVAAALTGVTPLIMAGTLAGALVGRLTDGGLTKQMMQPVADALTPGPSALFGLGRVTQDEHRAQIVERVRQFRPRIVEASVSPELRASIERLLQETPTAQPS